LKRTRQHKKNSRREIEKKNETKKKKTEKENETRRRGMEYVEDECRGEHDDPGKRRKIGEREMDREKNKKYNTGAKKKTEKIKYNTL
jgi:hypothetical protein